MNEIKSARIQKLVEFTALCQDIHKRRGCLSNKSAIRKLESYRLPLTVIKGDDLLGAVAAKDLESLDGLIEYLKTGDEQALERSIEANKQRDALICALLDGGGKNVV